MSYIIRNAYLYIWGREINGNPMVSIDEIREFAKENSMDLDDVMYQFILDIPFYEHPKGEPGNEGLVVGDA